MIRLRPHHGLCLHFYEGKGYSEDFVNHLDQLVKELKENPQIVITYKTDDVCSCCPNNCEGQCASEKVLQYDESVSSHCNLEEGLILSYNEWRNLIFNNVIGNGKIKEICKDCSWAYICLSKINILD